MNLKQYKRLQLVLLLPLLIAGFLSMSKEFFFPAHHWHTCTFDEGVTVCSSELRRRSDGRPLYPPTNISIGFWNVAFRASIEQEIVPDPAREVPDSMRASTSNPQKPNTRLLRLSPGMFEFCRLIPAQDDLIEWSLSCRSSNHRAAGVVEFFRLEKSESQSPIMRLYERGRTLNQQNPNTFNKYHLMNFAAPLVLFYGLSGILFIFIMTYRFVKDGTVHREQ